MVKINFDVVMKGNLGISICVIVIKEDEQYYIYIYELGEMDNYIVEWVVCIYVLEYVCELNV